MQEVKTIIENYKLSKLRVVEPIPMDSSITQLLHLRLVEKGTVKRGGGAERSKVPEEQEVCCDSPPPRNTRNYPHKDLQAWLPKPDLNKGGTNPDSNMERGHP